MLLEELASTRALVGRMLDQQQMLVQTIAQLTTGGAVATGAAPAAAAAPPAATAAAAAPASPARSAVAAPPTPAASHPSPKATSSSGSSSSSGDVPAPNSLADLFRNAATAASNNPAGAAAAAAIAAAVAAVDSRDILTAPADTLLPPAAPAAGTAGDGAGVSLPQPPIVFGTSGAVEEQAAAPVAAGPDGGAGAEPIERPKASPTDAPPDLVIGDDDIFWMSKLHAGLEERGFHPGDDDMENWMFGEATMNAVLTFQASERLPETGVVDRPTWTALLGAEVADELYSRAAAAAAATATAATAPVAAATAPSSSGSGSSSGRGTAKAGEPQARWKVLMEGDGGKEVHALQVALSNCGFHTDEDDMLWWQFGDSTLNALRFYQSCNGLPESGVCDERTWRSLIAANAPEVENPQPHDIYGLRLNRGSAGGSDDEDNFEEDMEGITKGRVWLLGEQRWEKRP
ncbi:hypothetical protein HXX76_014271 [Chlamydomonas incerta]|uniref:Peptidoglycan binding-like domain-containing protein n=1 Tax=Chlamydomonas incerta TaxID=51695 RepID=A0A835SQ02_CHLIN|nr:hypothetical protein HXX76_014271 [Chlamydomonas incerta]|eukprot:KAG2424695.1 hypothetical protein HXX76_014271 [Chlamydomonas incerta]